MRGPDQCGRRSGVALVVGGLLLVFMCLAVGSAVTGAVAGSVVGGWLGIDCAVVLALVVGVLLQLRTRKQVRG